MANRPDDPVLEFHIRHIPGGAASSHVAERLRPGDTVRLTGPYGSAHLRPGHDGPLLAVAGGSGLAPIRSIITTALAGGFDLPLHLYFGVRAERDVYGEAALAALAAAHRNFRYTIVLSAPDAPTGRRTGPVHAAVAEDLGRLAGFRVHLAGPPAMVDAATAMARGRGAAPADIQADPFLPAAANDGAPTRGGLLRALGGLFARG
jgi:CDP-4-dehydro-6-deoxyglucose reductase/ferredoxin-NAD(P)+ reductase (naphthalene dioxygenase ferredoxin-specific)